MQGILGKCIANVNISGGSEMKRRYLSGPSKQKKKKDATKKTSHISTYFSNPSITLYITE